MKTKNWCCARMLFVRYKFRHIQHNTTLFIHFSNLSLVCIWHLLMTQQNGVVANLHSTNCSGAPSVVWNPHFIFVYLVHKDKIFYHKSNVDDRELILFAFWPRFFPIEKIGFFQHVLQCVISFIGFNVRPFNHQATKEWVICGYIYLHSKVKLSDLK